MDEQAKVGIGVRFIAALIDGILTSMVSWFIPILGAIISTVYMLIKDGLFEGQSIGKKVMNLKVVTTHGVKADFNVSVKRNIIFAIPSILMIIPVLGWILAPILALVILIVEVMKIMSDPKGRRLGDQWADSMVVAADAGTSNEAN